MLSFKPKPIDKRWIKLTEDFCKFYGTSLVSLKFKKRIKDLVWWRVFYTAFMAGSGASSTVIAKILKRDHATILYYLKKWKRGDIEIK